MSKRKNKRRKRQTRRSVSVSAEVYAILLKVAEHGGYLHEEGHPSAGDPNCSAAVTAIIRDAAAAARIEVTAEEVDAVRPKRKPPEPTVEEITAAHFSF